MQAHAGPQALQSPGGSGVPRGQETESSSELDLSESGLSNTDGMGLNDEQEPFSSFPSQSPQESLTSFADLSSGVNVDPPVANLCSAASAGGSSPSQCQELRAALSKDAENLYESGASLFTSLTGANAHDIGGGLVWDSLPSATDNLCNPRWPGSGDAAGLRQHPGQLRPEPPPEPPPSTPGSSPSSGLAKEGALPGLGPDACLSSVAPCQDSELLAKPECATSLLRMRAATAPNVHHGSLRVHRWLAGARRRPRCGGILLHFMARCPGVIAMIWLIFFSTIASVGLITMPVELETSFDSFMKADVNSSLVRDGFLTAIKASPGNGRRLEGTGITMYRLFDLSVVYELKNDWIPEGLFRHRILRSLARFESQLRQLPEWTELCGMVNERHRAMCDPGMSFANYVLPSVSSTPGSVVPQSITLDGKGRDPLPLEAAHYILQKRELEEIFLPSDYDTSNLQRGPHYLRSYYRFKMPCGTTTDTVSLRWARVRKLTAKWEAFAKGTLMPFLREAFSDEAPVRVYFEGTGFQTLEVMEAFWQDISFAGGSALFVLMYLAIHTRSILLTLAAVLIIPLALPVAYVSFALLAGSKSLGIASFLSVFLVVGLGTDVVFIYTDMWKDSAQHHDTDLERLAWTYTHAGKATFATTSTTALSFMVNLASVIRPLREFGLFMGLCVAFSWVLLSLIYVPLCLADERIVAWRSGGRRQSRAERAFSVALGTWTLRLGVCRFPLCALPLVLLVIFICFAARAARPETGIPELFPAGHNQNRGRLAFEYFKVSEDAVPLNFRPPPTVEHICGHGDSTPGGSAGSCAFNWCEVRQRGQSAASRGNATNTSCTCFRNQSTCGAIGQNAVMWLAGVGSVTDASFNSIRSYLGATGAPMPVGSFVWEALPNLLLNDWEAGEFDFVPVVKISVPMPSSSCGWEEHCFCGGAGSCLYKTPPWQRQVQMLDLAGPVVPSRLLTSQWQVPSNRRTNVDVVYGLEINVDTPLLGKRHPANHWSFVDGFDIRQPWAQRDVYRMCTEHPDDLQVTGTFCWIVDFYKYLQQRSPPERFPVTAGKFDRLLLDFAAVGVSGNGLSKRFLWIRDGKLKACFLTIQVDVDKYSSVEDAFEYKKKWDRFMRKSNTLASEYTGVAIHTSTLWVQAEARNALISSTSMTLSIVFALAFLTMLVFTGSIRLSLHVVAATLEVLSGLFFFMVVVAGWAMGPIEVLALIVFLGYALDYSLHVAQKYGEEEAAQMPLSQRVNEILPLRGEKLDARLRRVTHALKSIGAATTGSAVTTSGCSVFLIFCQLTIFKKLGIVVVVVTLLSLSMALVALPATLLVVGPLHKGGSYFQARCSRVLGRFRRRLEQQAQIDSDGDLAEDSSCAQVGMQR